MGVLLDTCVFLWLLGLPERLPDKVRERLRDAGTRCSVSTASLWECLLKHGKGRLGFTTGGRTALDFLLWNCERHALDVLPIRADALRPLERLPAIHSDPFDRLLICQAIEEGLAIVTPDPRIRRYPIKTFWE
jgi:PIN domain nuclease of toxin-antitoxin system